MLMKSKMILSVLTLSMFFINPSGYKGHGINAPQKCLSKLKFHYNLSYTTPKLNNKLVLFLFFSSFYYA